MQEKIFYPLPAEELSGAAQERIRRYETERKFSLHWELKTMLYLGVVLLNVGLGWLIYENLNTIGHNVIIALIAAVCGGCFYYCVRQRVPFSWNKMESPSPYYDYSLLLGCLTFLILEGYLQYQYTIFGTQYGMATFVPMVVFFLSAYVFDHRGALSLAITALGSWLGVAVTPRELLSHNDFSSSRFVNTGIILGILLCVAAFLSVRREIKKHFSLTYLNFGMHIVCIAALSGLMALDQMGFLPILLGAGAYFIYYARSEKSLYFLTVTIIYLYVGLTYLLFQVGDAEPILWLWYFLFSAVGVILFFINYKKILRIQ